MFIRGTRVQTPPDKLEAAIANFKQQVLPAARSAPGNLGATLLVDRQSGLLLGTERGIGLRLVFRTHGRLSGGFRLNWGLGAEQIGGHDGHQQGGECGK